MLRRTARRMPTYVYGCDACGHQFERSQKFSDDPIRTCPECTSDVRRIFQPAGIVFKGSGWHITDYKRSGNGSTASSTNGAAESKPEKAETGGSDAKASDSTAAGESKPAASAA
jgi:putative FmdB family regulatory protein